MGCGKSKLIKKIDELEEKLGDEQLANLKVKDTLLAKKEDVEARDQEIQALDAELQRKEAQALEQMKAEQAEKARVAADWAAKWTMMSSEVKSKEDKILMREEEARVARESVIDKGNLEELNKQLQRQNSQLVAEFEQMKQKVKRIESLASGQIKLAEISLEREKEGFERRRSIDQENFAEKENEYKHEIEKVIEEKEEAKQQARIMTHASLELVKTARVPLGTGGAITMA